MKHNAAELGDHLRAYYLRDEHGFELREAEDPIALIRAGVARVYGGASVEGNFLTEGPHWRRLRLRLAEHKKRQMRAVQPLDSEAEMATTAPKRSAESPRRRILVNAAPEGLEPDLVNAVLQASRRIRERRRLVFDRPVTLESELGTLILSPIAGIQEHLRVPFVLVRHHEGIEGEIRLSASHDPLPVDMDELVGDSIGSVWAAALLGLADVTCFDPPIQDRREPIVSSPPSHHRLGHSRSRNGRYRQIVRRRDLGEAARARTPRAPRDPFQMAHRRFAPRLRWRSPPAAVVVASLRLTRSSP